MTFCFLSKAQTDDTLRVVNWNIEWFGSPSAGPSNDNQQEINVLKILRYLDADIYALSEIVDTLRLKRVTDSLGGNYGFRVSYFASAAPSVNSPNYSSAQKLAFIYKRNVFSNIETRAMLNNGSDAYYNFASGRFPFLFNANVDKNGKKRNISFVLIHGKAGATTNDYNRRRFGAIELKDTLDNNFTSRPMVLLGDYNDELYTSIVTGYVNSSYQVIVQDSIRTNNNYYHSITLPLGKSGQQSTISYSNVIDHQVINKRMDSMYVPFSAAIRADVVNAVPDYYSRSTSDHFPVSSNFLVIAGDTSAVIINPPPPPPPPVVFTGFKVWPNPFDRSIIFRSGKNLTNVTLTMYNSIGVKVWEYAAGTITTQLFNEFQLPYLSSGLYVMRITSKEETIQFKLVKQ
jgi:hypothetical protein